MKRKSRTEKRCYVGLMIITFLLCVEMNVDGNLKLRTSIVNRNT